MSSSGYQMHTQGRRPPASAAEWLRGSSGVTQPAGWQHVRATVLTPYPGALQPDPCWTGVHTPSLGSDPQDCRAWDSPLVKEDWPLTNY